MKTVVNDGSSQQTCRCTHCRFQTAIIEEKTCCVDTLCGQRSDSFQPRGLLLHNGPAILPHDYAKSDCARSCIHSEFSLQEEPCHCTSCFEQQVRSSLSLSLFFLGCYKNGGGEGRCVVSSACRLNLSGKGTCKLTQLIMKQTSKLSSVI